MIGKLLFHIISAALGLFLAAKIVPGVQILEGSFVNIGWIGIILGLVNFFIRPIIKALALPLRIITLGAITMVINMFMVWIVADIMFPQYYEIKGIVALFWTTIIIWTLDYLIAEIFFSSRKNPMRK